MTRQTFRHRAAKLALLFALASPACGGTMGDRPGGSDGDSGGQGASTDAAANGLPRDGGPGAGGKSGTGGGPGGASGGSGGTGGGGGSGAGGAGDPSDPLAGLPTGAAQLQGLCGRKIDDAVTRAFCAATPPRITSLTDLEHALGLDFKPGVVTAKGVAANATAGNPGFAMIAHSSSLVARLTNPAFPRTFIFTPPKSEGGLNMRSPTPYQPNPQYVVMAFVRGDQLVELGAKGSDGQLRFYLLRYKQACSDKPGGCSPGDLFTPEVERNFTGYTVYQDDDIENTTVDCKQCHQPGGPSSAKLLLMPELQYPWKHWMFGRFTDNDQNTLEKAFLSAHDPGEDYGGLPTAAFPRPPLDPHGAQGPEGAMMQGLIENNGFADNQPVDFTGSGGKRANEANDPPSQNPAWQRLYDAAKASKTIPPPYVDFTASDTNALTGAIAAYRSVMAGTTSHAQLPDVTDVFLRSALPLLVFLPAPGLTGPEILVQACGQCHNSRLKQTLSRASFNAMTVDRLSRPEKDEAIRRLKLPVTSARHMPPHRFRDLPAADLAAVIQVLQQ